ncbi:hypothetical protein TRVL_04284 [Trypanosoma vivax]|nr:hypothetical protein TRVL_04284 [Trypanosoma vivax]
MLPLQFATPTVQCLLISSSTTSDDTAVCHATRRNVGGYVGGLFRAVRTKSKSFSTQLEVTGDTSLIVTLRANTALNALHNSLKRYEATGAVERKKESRMVEILCSSFVRGRIAGVSIHHRRGNGCSEQRRSRVLCDS